MRTEGMDQVRAALKAFDGPVTVGTLSVALELETESQKQVLRRRLHEMIARGEVEKTARGLFRYLPGKEPSRRGEGYRRVWRLIRMQTPGWTKQDLAALSRYERSGIDRYVNWLEGEGFVARHGRTGNTILWRTTAKALEQRDTPFPPVDLPDPYAAERAATGRLCTLMLTKDPAQVSVQRQIKDHLAVLTARFGTQVENTDHDSTQENVC